MTTAQRRQIVGRDGPLCPHCGAAEGLGIQHRAVKGFGGRPSAEVPSNLILLCNLLNVAVEQDADVAAHADRMGWKLSTYAVTTERAVFDAVSWEWWVLDDEWGRRLARDTPGGFTVLPDPVWGH